jgi:dTDP-4-dehydrorhamnose 3,5-epimerase
MNKTLTDGIRLDGVRVIKNDIHIDNRGFLIESYSKHKMPDLNFVQDNLVSSCANTIRGLHFQKAHPQGKLITVVTGCIYDVCVDIRDDSPTYGRWFSILLSNTDFTQIYIPGGFAHGFLSITDSVVIYKCTEFYYPDDQHGYIWNDEALNINWQINKSKIILSDKDKKLPKFNK